LLKNAIQKIGKFYDINLTKTPDANGMFDVLHEIIKFDTAAVFYLTPDFLSLEFSKNYQGPENIKINEESSKIFYDTPVENITDTAAKVLGITGSVLAARLTVKETVIGLIVISRTQEEFSLDEKLIFETCSKIIANIIKDLEISDVLKMQVKAMEEGIVETRQAYETIKKQNKKIKQNEKLQNQFIANISHDLRTPLNSIISTTEVLGGKFFGELNEKQQDYILDIKAAGLKLLGMINEILDMAKIESHTIKLNLSEFKLSDTIFEVCNIIEPLAVKKNLQIEKKLDNSIKITADYIKIQQIILNILGNAVKYAKSMITIQTYKNDNKIFISIKDDGAGINKKHHKKIFDKFYQVEDNLSKTETSTGLGLTIAKEFAKLHGGRIDVLSSDGTGAEFVVELPAAA